MEILEKMKTMTSFSMDGKDQIEQLKAFSPFNTTVAAPFLDTGLMFGVDCFDIVLMNPPYFSLSSLAKKNNPYKGEKFDTYASRGDIYQLFIEKAFQFINDNGLISAVVSNKWMRTQNAVETRKWLYQNAHTIEILDLGSGWFDSAEVDINIITYEKRGMKPYQTMIPACIINNKVRSVEEGKQTKEQKYIVPSQKGDSWIIMNDIETRILEKINRAGRPLKDWDIKINYGIKTGLNDAFIINGVTKDRLIAEDPKSAEIIKPLLKGEDIKRYSYEFADKWLLFIPWHFPLHKNIVIKGNSLEAEEEFEKQYPAIYKYLLQYKDQLLARNKAETGIRYEWYALQRCAATYYQDFDKPKIIYAETQGRQAFSYDQQSFYLDKTAFFLTSDTLDLRYLLSIFSSKIIYFYIKNNFGILGNSANMYAKIYMENLPIPIPNEEQEQQITELVQTILQKKAQMLPTDAEEKEIDRIVYQLYGLTEDEIAAAERKDSLE